MAAFGTLVAPHEVVVWPLAAVLLGATLVTVVFVSNVLSVGESIAAESWPAAIAIAASAGYAVVIAGLVVRSVLRG